MRVDGENLGTAPIERVLMRYPGVTEVAVYGIPDEVGDRVMAALVLGDGAAFDAATFDAADFRRFLAGQDDLGPKQGAVVRPGVIDVAPDRDLQGDQAAAFRAGTALRRSGFRGPALESRL